MLFGEFDSEEDAVRAACIAFWDCVANGATSIKLDKYHVVIYPDRRVDEWVFYVAIFTQEEWRKVKLANCHKHVPTEFKHFIKKMMHMKPV